ncbi:MAG TPA: hypothetical protein VNE61_15520 [Ktedonobacteraceae bacterium]|nr:hypothetical protein [Ktedonobacteraceae bacterium]
MKPGRGIACEENLLGDVVSLFDRCVGGMRQRERYALFVELRRERFIEPERHAAISNANVVNSQSDNDTNANAEAAYLRFQPSYLYPVVWFELYHVQQ